MPKSILFDKNEVIEKVTLLFWEKGYNGTSMQDLVNVTGLNRSSFYNTFKGGKFELFCEALKHYQSTQNKNLENIQRAANSPKEFIGLLFDSVWQDIEHGKLNGCFMAKCTAELSNLDDGISTFLQENMRSIVEMFEKLIEEGQELGEIDKTKSPEILARYLFSSLQGLRITSMIDKNPTHIKRISSQILGALN